MSAPDFDPEYVFSHHHANAEQLAAYAEIHESAKQFAKVILARVPEGVDRVTALRLLRESSMMACAGVSLGGRLK
ncbi:MAG TPA: hypothetical protein VNN72_05655 [Polyangiaceae bacterium]|nr:hypothetical protein [Polyangiaceae bacterium]